MILSTGNSAASRTFWRVISGVSMPIENVVSGASAGIEAEQAVERDPEPLADPVVERDVERGARRVLALELAEGVAQEALEPPGVGGARERLTASSAFLPSAAFSW